MKRNAYLAIGCMAAIIACAAPAPYPLPVNSRSQTAPPVVAYAGNLNTYRVTLTDGNTASPIVGAETPYMNWATNVAALPATGTCYIVAGTTGVFDVVFPPSQVNYAAGRYMYEVGVKSNGVPRTFKHGTFQIIGSPIGSGLGYVNWTTNLNWGSIVWGGLPTITVNGQPFSIATNSTLTVTGSGVDDVARASISVLETGKVSQAQWTAGSNSFATAEQGAKADTAIQSETDPVALGALGTHADSSDNPHQTTAMQTGAATPAAVTQIVTSALSGLAVPTQTVASVNGYTGVVALTASDVGAVPQSVGPEATFTMLEDGYTFGGVDQSTSFRLDSSVYLVDYALGRGTREFSLFDVATTQDVNAALVNRPLTIAGTTNALPADANKTNGVVYLVYP